MTYHEESVIRPSADDPDLDPVLGVPLAEPNGHETTANRERGIAYACIAIEDVDVVAGVEVVNRTLTVDLECVCLWAKPSEAICGAAAVKRHLRSSILMLTEPHQMSSLLVSSKTMRLSFGLRPVFFPEKLMSAPEEEMMAPSLRMASS